MKTAWDPKTKQGKLLFALRTAASAGAFVCALLRLFRVWDRGVDVAIPLLGIALLIQAVQDWKQNRFEAILVFCAALFIFVSSTVVWFME